MLVIAVFLATYVGMALGRIPGLKVERTGIALIAVAVLLVTGAVAPHAAATHLDGGTLVLMFGLMVLSAQFAQAGFYAGAAQAIVSASAQPRRLLALTVAVGGGLSMVLVNDIVVFAMVPMLCAGLTAAGRDPRPYLIGLAGAANAGSAATLIGNPQNILIGQIGDLDFWHFFATCAPPAVVALVIVYATTAWIWRRELGATAPPAPEGAAPTVDRAQMLKGFAATAALLVLFATPLPRELSALAVAALLLASRRVASGSLLTAVDWQLLLLIACLFVVTGAFAASLNTAAVDALRVVPPPESLRVLAPAALLLSNTIGNVPATILIVSVWPTLAAGTLTGLALLSTLAGNLLLVGSLCNIIVAERAAQHGTPLTFRDFARAGVPMTVASMLVAALWLRAGGWMPV